MTLEEIKIKFRGFPALVHTAEVWFSTCKRFKSHCTLLDMDEETAYNALEKKLLDKARKAGFTKVNIKSKEQAYKDIEDTYNVKL